MATRNLSSEFFQLRSSFKRDNLSLSTDDHVIEMSQIRAGFDRKQLLGADSSQSEDHAVALQALPPAWVDLVEEIDRQVKLIKEKMNQLQATHERHLRNPGFDDHPEEEHTIDILTQDITSTFRQCENNIKSIGGTNLGSKEQLLRKNVQSKWATQLQDLSVKFRKSQREYLEGVLVRSDGLKRQSDLGRVASGLAPLDMALEEDEYYDRGFTEEQMNVLMTNESVVQERGMEIQKIAESINDLAEIFRELSILVIDQGTMLDRIDYNVEQVSQLTQAALEETRKASKYQKKFRTKLCILVLILLITVFGILLIIKSAGGFDALFPSSSEPAATPAPSASLFDVYVEVRSR